MLTAKTQKLRSKVTMRVRRALHAAASAVGNHWHVIAANLWRDQYNPLRGLTISRAVHLLEEGERGAYADLQWTYRYIEMQDAVLGSLIESRSAALEQMDWGITISDRAKTPAEKAVAAAQAETLKAVYDGIDNLQDAISFLAIASFRGFAHLEIVRAASGDVVELRPVEQWFWVRRGLGGEWEYNRDSKIGSNAGEPAPMDRFIVREVQRPINRVALIAYIRKSLSQKDWDAFVETYGIPPLFVIMPPDLGDPQRAEFQEIANEIIGDSRGVLPGNSKVETIDNGARGENPFLEHIKYQDEQMVLRGTGGKLTMLTESGSGTLAGGAHMETFRRLAAAEAKKISEIFRATLDAQVLANEFPGQPVYAGFAIAENEETDTGAIVADAVKLAGAGYQVEAGWLQEKTGYKLARGVKNPLANEQMAVATTLIKNRFRDDAAEGEPVGDGALLELLALAQNSDMALSNGQLRNVLLSEDTETMLEALRAWYDGLPATVGRTPELESAFERAITQALAEGME